MSPLLLVALQQAPAVIDLVRNAFTNANPGAPVPSDTEVFAALDAAFKSSLARDDAWLAAHPQDDGA